MDKLGEGSDVDFKINEFEYGSGIIRGYHSITPKLVMYIVELTKRETAGLKAYPYSCVVLPEGIFKKGENNGRST